MSVNWKLLLLIFILECLVVLMLLPSHYLVKTLEREQQYTYDYLGEDSYSYIIEKANDWYNTSIIETGTEDTLYDMFVPTAEDLEKDSNAGVSNLAPLYFKYAGSRVDTLMTVVYIIYYRVITMVVWIPMVGLMILAAYFEGYWERKIRQNSFKHASHTLHGIAFNTLKWFVLIIFIGMFIPLALPPLFYPVLGLVLACLIGISMSNLQKRI